MVDFEVQRCTRRCAVTLRELAPGEEFYSALSSEGAALVRRDYSLAAWHGPPQGALGWWKSRVPKRDAKRLNFAPNDVMLELLESLESHDDQQDMRYVLALWLIRRRVVRLEETQRDAEGREVSVLYCPRRETTYHVVTTEPAASRVEEIQRELALLLSTGG